MAASCRPWSRSRSASFWYRFASAKARDDVARAPAFSAPFSAFAARNCASASIFSSNSCRPASVASTARPGRRLLSASSRLPASSWRRAALSALMTTSLRFGGGALLRHGLLWLRRAGPSAVRCRRQRCRSRSYRRFFLWRLLLGKSAPDPDCGGDRQDEPRGYPEGIRVEPLRSEPGVRS